MKLNYILSLTAAMLMAVAGADRPATAASNQQDTRPLRSRTDDKRATQQDVIKESDETLRLDVDLVDVVFTVVDRNNRLVPGLKQEQIELLENGAPQEIDYFEQNTNVPMIIALVIDVSGSQEFVLSQEKDAAESFFRSVFREGKDYAAIVTFRGDTYLAQGLTSDLKRLADSIRRIRRERIFRADEGLQSSGTSLYESIYLTIDEILEGKTARRVIGSDEVKRHAIRRAMILLTDGQDTTSQRSEKEAIDRANRSGVIIYSIGIGDNFRFGEVNTRALEELCRQTGGRAYFPQSESDLRKAFDQIVEELSSQYVLAYRPSNKAQDGSFRNIDIRIRGVDGLQVIHRKGYFARGR